MHDDGVVRRAAFNLEDTLDGGRVQRVCSQALDGLGRQRHQIPGAQQLRRPPHRRLEQFRRMRRQHFGKARRRLFHRSNLPATAPKAREKVEIREPKEGSCLAQLSGPEQQLL